MLNTSAQKPLGSLRDKIAKFEQARGVVPTSPHPAPPPKVDLLGGSQGLEGRMAALRDKRGFGLSSPSPPSTPGGDKPRWEPSRKSIPPFGEKETAQIASSNESPASTSQLPIGGYTAEVLDGGFATQKRKNVGDGPEASNGIFTSTSPKCNFSARGSRSQYTNSTPGVAVTCATKECHEDPTGGYSFMFVEPPNG